MPTLEQSIKAIAEAASGAAKKAVASVTRPVVIPEEVEEKPKIEAVATKKTKKKEEDIDSLWRKAERDLFAVLEEVEAVEMGYEPHDLTCKLIEFGKKLTQKELYKYQYDMVYRIIYSVLTNEGSEITGIVSRQAGKTESVAFAVVTLSAILPALAKYYPYLEKYKNGFWVGLFAPQKEQVVTTYTRAVNAIKNASAAEILRLEEIDAEMLFERRFVLNNGSYMLGQVISPLSKIESKTYHLIINEESQDTDSVIYEKSVVPMGTATNATYVKIGTTGRHKNHYWKTIQANKKNDAKLRDTRLRLHYEFDYRKVLIDREAQYRKDKKPIHLDYARSLKKYIEKYGKDSEAFRMSYELIWPLSEGMFLSDGQFNSLLDRKRGLPAEPQPEWRMVAGLDIGKSRSSTILTIGQCISAGIIDQFNDKPLKVICDWMELPKGMDYEDQHYAIVDRLVYWGVEVLAADYTGVGRPVVDRLIRNMTGIHIIPFTFSTPTKSDLYQDYYSDICAGRLLVPANKKVQQLETFTNFKTQHLSAIKYWNKSYLVVEKDPDDPNANDDYCDSSALMCHAGNFTLPDTEAVVAQNPFYENIAGIRGILAEMSYEL